MSVERQRGSDRRTNFPWVGARKLIQLLFLMGFLYTFTLIGRQGRMGENPAHWLGELPLQLDPLIALAHSTAGRVFLRSSLLALGMVALTLIFGRVWCGWLCPLGTLLDWFPIRKPGDKIRIPESWRRVKYVLLGVIFIGALFSNLTLLIFDPLTLVYRTLTTAVWPALNQLITAGEKLFYRVPFLREPVAVFDGFARRHLLPSELLGYRAAWLFAGLFLGVIALNAAAPRFWCRYVCPLGGLLGLLGKASWIKCRVNARCTECGICEAVCPTGAISGEEGGRCVSSECTMCMACQEACSRQAVHFTPELSFSERQPFDPGRREVLISLGVSLAGFGLARVPLTGRQIHPHRLHPPGAQGESFLGLCVRCGECLAACPTGGLQPALLESGWAGLWSPILIPRLGQCDYSCRACAQACPVQAIPSLSLESKRKQVIGKAYLNRRRCIAWEEERDCIVCEEMCPVPEKAITFRRQEIEDPEGNLIEVLQPRIDRELCIGCGICEHQCPVEGEAAIRVFSPDWRPDILDYH